MICPPAVQTTPPPATASPKIVALSGAAVFIGVGDIADCTSSGDEATAAIVDSVLKADSVAHVEDAVFTLGDNAYPVGSDQSFAQCFAPSWGDSTKSIMKKIHPAAGNHEHVTDLGSPYYRYFGKRVGDPKKGYYSYDVGEWHMIVLNSAILVNVGFGQEDESAQAAWLRQDMVDHRKACTIAMWHHPRFSSGFHGGDTRMLDLWKILYDANVDVVLNGHDHDYERFAPLDPIGVPDTARGIAEFVVGTGGGELRSFRNPPAPHSLARVQGHFGVLKLTLGAGEYQFAFLDVTGRAWDQGGGKCH
jgi:hypothetical protein